MNKKVIAKEWLFFLKWLLLGLAVVPFLSWLVILVISGNNEGWIIGEFYIALLLNGSRDVGFLVAWLLVLIPYGIFNLIRSIRWAKQQLK